MLTTPLTKKVLDIGRANHQRFRPLEHTGTIESTVWTEGWVYEPIPVSIIPVAVKKQIEPILKSGIGVQQVIMGHEVTRLLARGAIKMDRMPAPMPSPKPAFAPPPEIKIDLAALGKVVEVAGVVLAAIMASPLLLLLAIDPCIVIVLEDGSWVETMFWYGS